MPQRKPLPHNLPSWIRPDTATFFITICCATKGENQLCREEIAAGIFESVSFRQSRHDWWMELLLLMPDHLHALVSFPSDKGMTTVISRWKEFLAKKFAIRWQRDFFDHRLRNDENLRDKAAYILQNPVRRGLVTRAEDWSYVWMPDRWPETLVGLDRRASRPVIISNAATTAARPAVAPYQRPD